MLRKKLIMLLLCAGVVVIGILFSGCGKETEQVNYEFENEINDVAEVVEAEKTIGDKTLEVDKEETVQVEADATGNVKKITVETKLNKASGDTIPDYSVLQKIKNTEGDEEFRKKSDGTIEWENHSELITYEGTTEKELPVKMKITYWLDGKEITPEKLAGQSGELTMRFDYENLCKKMVTVQEKEIEVAVPFSAFSMVILPEEVFSNVSVKNGKVLSVGDNRMAIGYAFPGLEESLCLTEMEDFEDVEIPDYVEVTAQVNHFALDFTATVIGTDVFEDFDIEDLEDVEELIADMRELGDASKELVDGTKELQDGVDEFGDYLREYVDAMTVMKDGTAGIQQGVGKLKKYSKELKEGANSLQSGLTALQSAVGGTESGAAEGQGGSGDGVDLMVLVTDMNARIATLEEQIADNPDAQAQLLALENDAIALQAYAAVISEQAAGLENLQPAVEQLVQGSNALAEGLIKFDEGVGTLYKGSEKLNDGAREIRDAGKELTDGYDELKDGVKEFKDGVEKFDKEGISEITKKTDGDLQKLVNCLRAVKEADGTYNNFGGILPGKTGSVKFIIETEEVKKK